MTNAAITTTQSEEKLKAIMRSDEIRTKFAEVIGGNNAAAYISSVLIAVSESPYLQRCTPTSIISSALRAATMRLSVEPSLGHAYLVPFRDKCTLVIGYRGIYQLALRTGQYRFLDLITVTDDDTVTQHPLNGMHSLVRGARSEKIIGYLLYFKLVTGFEKTFYMTCEECDAHGQKYSKSYHRDDSLWKTNPQAMYKKTVMRLGLMRWGLFTDIDSHNLNAADDSMGDLPAFIETFSMEDQPKIDPGQAMDELGFGDPHPQQQIEAEFIEPPEEAPVDPEPAAEIPAAQAKPVTAKEVKDLADKKGVDIRGLNEVLAKNSGDLQAAFTQLQAL